LKIKEEYDVILIGDSLSGLVCANLLVQEGVSVLCVPNKEERDEEFSNTKIPFEFSPNILVGMKKGQICQKILEKIGFDLSQTQEIHPSLQLISARNRVGSSRVNFYTEYSKTVLEMEREYGSYYLEGARCFSELYQFSNAFQSEESLELYLTQADFVNSARKKIQKHFSISSPSNLMKVSRSLGFENELSSLLMAGSYFLGRRIPNQIQFSESLVATSLLLGGGVSIPGGISEFKQGLINSFLKLGGHLKKTKVERVLHDGKNLDGVMLASFEGQVKSGKVICATDPYHSSQLFDEEVHLFSDPCLRVSTPKALTLSLEVVVKKEFLSIMAGDLIFFVEEPRLEATEGNTAMLQISPLLTEVPEGSVKVIISTVILIEEEGLRPIRLQRIERWLRQKLLELFPYVKGSEIYVSPSPESHEEILYYYSTHENLPVEAKWYPTQSLDPLGLNGLPIRSRLKNIYTLNPLNFPAMGNYGEFIGASICRNYICDSMRRGPFSEWASDWFNPNQEGIEEWTDD